MPQHASELRGDSTASSTWLIDPMTPQTQRGAQSSAEHMAWVLNHQVKGSHLGIMALQSLTLGPTAFTGTPTAQSPTQEVMAPWWLAADKSCKFRDDVSSYQHCSVSAHEDGLPDSFTQGMAVFPPPETSLTRDSGTCAHSTSYTCHHTDMSSTLTPALLASSPCHVFPRSGSPQRIRNHFFFFSLSLFKDLLI